MRLLGFTFGVISTGFQDLGLSAEGLAAASGSVSLCLSNRLDFARGSKRVRRWLGRIEIRVTGLGFIRS